MVVGVGVASGASGGGVGVGERSELQGGLTPSVARLPPVGLASSRRRRRIASFTY